MQGINARVATIAVGYELHEERTVAFSCPLAGILDGMPRSDDVHTIDLFGESVKQRV
jgi:hypothetical protein